MSMHYTDLPAGQESFFPPKRMADEFGKPVYYGMFGYEGAMTEEALKQEHEGKIKECHQRGWIAPETRCLDGSTLVEYCETKGKNRSAALLRKLGYQ